MSYTTEQVFHFGGNPSITERPLTIYSGTVQLFSSQDGKTFVEDSESPLSAGTHYIKSSNLIIKITPDAAEYDFYSVGGKA